MNEWTAVSHWALQVSRAGWTAQQPAPGSWGWGPGGVPVRCWVVPDPAASTVAILPETAPGIWPWGGALHCHMAGQSPC